MKPDLNSRHAFVVLIVLLALIFVACERPLNEEPAATPTTETPVDTPPDAETQPEGGTEGEAPPTLIPTRVPPGAEDTSTPTEPAPEGGEAAPPSEEGAEEATPPDQGGEAEQPAPEPEQPVAPPGEQAHVVQPGENLFRIGLRYGCTVNELAAFNGIANPNYINVGQVVRIPATCGG